MLFFQLMSSRYEHGSTVLTSNESFEEWGDVFGDEVMAAALIDSADLYLGQGLEAEGPETPVGKTPQRECMAVLRIHNSGEANKPAGNGERSDLRDINILQTM